MAKKTDLLELFDSISNLGEIALVLRPLQEGPLTKWVLISCVYNQSGVSSIIPNVNALISISIILGLVKTKRRDHQNFIFISELGRKLLRYKQIEKDRLTIQQGKLLFLHLMEQVGISHEIASVVNLFNITPNGDLLLNCFDNRIGTLEEQVLRFLQQLKIAKHIEGNIIIKSQEKEWLLNAIYTELGLDKESFLKLLEQKRKYGELAEEFALQFEKNRLIDCGRPDLAKLTKKISDQNVSTGYDILSFNGLESSFLPDRFIEVKGTTSGHVLFYITKNEIETAKRMQNNYWIYCILNVDSEKSKKLKMIRNPYKVICETKEFSSEPILWKVYLP